ncbi:MAG: CDP-alcohol phosphatidyltransferase family protein [Deltaproteobacteria bacterium]|nr:CDP-alcohol phosphatidyltransferase family protein [Deltaproteobacteria bacterium]
MTIREKASPSGVRHSYPAWKARVDQLQNPYSHYVLAPLAFRLAPIFINCGVSANTVTGCSLLLLIGGLTLVGFGAVRHANFLFVAVCLNLVILLDNIDGHVARFTGHASTFGALFDDLVTWVHFSVLPLCLGVGLFYAPPESSVLALGIAFPRGLWITAGVVKMLAYLFSMLVGYKVELLLGAHRYHEGVAQQRGLVLAKAIREIESPLLVIAAAAGILSFLFISYTVYSVGILVVAIIRALRETALSDRERARQG